MEFNPYTNPSIYDDLFEAKSVDCELYVAIARKYNSQRILERFCGTGRILLKLFHSLVSDTMERSTSDELLCYGLDREPAMLQRMTSKASMLPQSNHNRVEAIVGDATQFHGDGERKFDLVIDGSGSFHLLTSQQMQLDALTCAHSLLATSGIYVLDLWNPDIEWLAQCSKRESLELSNISDSPSGPISVRKIASSYSPVNQKLIRHIFVERYEPNGRQVGSWYQHEVFRVIHPGELTLLLNASRLRLVELYGSYSSHVFRDGSRRMIAICTTA